MVSKFENAFVSDKIANVSYSFLRYSIKTCSLAQPDFSTAGVIYLSFISSVSFFIGQNIKNLALIQKFTNLTSGIFDSNSY